MKALHIIILLASLTLTATAGETEHRDSTSSHRGRWSAELRYVPAYVISTDEYVDKWLKSNSVHAIVAELHHHTLPADSSIFDKAFRYPTLSVGIRYSINHGTVMHRDPDPAWGQLIPVDYDTRMGNNLTLYGTFERPLVRHGKWEFSTYIGTGIGYSQKKYNRTDQIDNELIGSHLNIFFTGGIVATWHLHSNWMLRGGIDFSHHSNGALHRPNKGANYCGPFIGVGYDWSDWNNQSNRNNQSNQNSPNSPSNPGSHPSYLDLTLGIGAKTMEEDWQRTQFGTAPDAPDYRTCHFRLYAAYSIQAAWMYHYGITRASGLGLDIFYGTYSDHVRRLDEAAGYSTSHNPWSVALAARHNVYYNNLSARFALGYYLYRHMGVRAEEVEKPYYERIGLHYSIPQLRNLSIGVSVKAHLFKADLTELQLSFPIKL